MRIGLAAAGAAILSLATPASAVLVPSGTLTFVALFNPTVNLTTSPATALFNGRTSEISGFGGFASASGLNGLLNGTTSFSGLEGTTIAQPLPDFFVFNDGAGGTFNFSATSVQTQTYADRPGISQGITLYLLGTTLDTNLNYLPTTTSLTLGFNQTAGSGYSASGTLAIAPAGPAVPEPATWAMFIGGFGLIGAAMRARRRMRVTTTTA